MAIALCCRGQLDQTCKPVFVAARHSLTRREQFLQPLDLRDSERAQDIRQPVVEACGRHVVVAVGRAPPVIAQRAGALREIAIACRQSAAVAGRHDLPRVKRETAGDTERPTRPPAVARADAKKEMSNLDGVWKVASTTYDGKDMPSGKYGTTLTIKGDQFAYEYNSGRTIEKGKLTLETSKTPKQLVMKARIDESLHLLAAGEQPLSEIALATGFCDQSAFTRHFHRLTGMPPGAFRQQAKGR